MILHPPNDGNLKEVLFLHDYHPYRMPGSMDKNPAFTPTDGLILDVKEGKVGAVTHFAALIADMTRENVLVAVVPGHDPEKTESGIRTIAQKIAASDGRRDGTALLVRHKKINKLATGGNRSLEVHLNSIKVVDKAKILEGANVLLLDDITTSNNSLEACKQLLRAAGAVRVQMLALGRTVRD